MGMESEPCHKNRHLMPVQSKCAKCTIPTCTNLISELCPPPAWPRIATVTPDKFATLEAAC